MKKLKIIIICIIVLILAISICILCNYDKILVDLNNIETDIDFQDVTYDKAENILNEDVLGILEIEKIGLKATVKEGTTTSILNDYIGHIENTSIYDGNIGLAAHNRGNKYSYFARINELKEGDVLVYRTKFYTRQYKVDKIAVIFDDDWSLLQNTEGNKITMITCIKNRNNQRLCVQATEYIQE